MTQRELEKLLKRPEVLQELEQSLFGDPVLWLSPEEIEAGGCAEEQKRQKERLLKAQVMRRVFDAQQETAYKAPRRRMGTRALQWSAAAACVMLLGCYIAFYPQAKSLATAHGERVARKVEGHVIIEEAVDEQPQNGLKYTGMRVSGVDGFEMHSYDSIGEYIEKTGRDPVLLTGGYEKIVSISDELDPDRGYTLMVAHELSSGAYISTSQFYSETIEDTIFADSYERTILGDKTMFCRVEDDSTGTYGLARLAADCSLFLYVPYEEQFDRYLEQLAFASTLDTSAFVIPPPEPVSGEDSGSSLEETSYATFEEFSRETGLWPVILDEGYAKPASIRFLSSVAMKTLSVEYKKDGHSIYAFQDFDAMGGSAYMMEDETYFATELLGEYTMHCSVDTHDGSAAGVALVKGSSFFVIAEKGIDFMEMLGQFYIMEH